MIHHNREAAQRSRFDTCFAERLFLVSEDQDRTRLSNGPQNLAILRQMALNAIQKETAVLSLTWACYLLACHRRYRTA